MAGEASKKPWWILTSSRGGSWWLAGFYTVLAVLESWIAFSAGNWWWWLIGVFLILIAVVAWASLAWVLRHQTPDRTTTQQRGAKDGDDG